MVLENILSEEIIQKLGWMLLHFIWQAAAVALLLGILLALLQKSSANVRYIIACAALGLIVLLPVITMQLVPVSTPQLTTNIETLPAPVIVRTQPIIEEKPPTVVVEHEEPAQVENTVVVLNISWKQRAVEWLESALPYLVAGWLLGVFGLSLWHLGGWAQLQRLKKQMVKHVEVSLQVKLNELSGRLKVKRAVQLLESALVQVPTVVGWLRPVILLPVSALTGLTAEQLEALLAHELAHIRRYDYLINMLQTVVETLGFYHPAVWWVSHRIRTERENCCDDLAVSISGDRIRYAKALTTMEEIRAGRSELAVAATGGNLFTRIRRIVGKDSNDSSRASWMPSVITILLIAIIAIPTTLALTSKPNSSDELLHFILIQNEKARKNFTTVSYKFELQSEGTFNLQGENLPARVVQGPRTLQKYISGEEFKKGKWRYSSMEQQDKSVYLQSGQTEQQNRLERAVFNDDYAASWHVGSIYAYQFDHESPSTMSERAQAHFALQSIDPIEYGFGDEEYTMMELYRRMKDKTPFKAQKSISNGRSVFQIKQFSSQIFDPKHPICAYVVDPEKGFLITSFTAYHQDGSISDEYVVEAEKVPGSSIWLPVRVQEKAYRRKSETTEYLPQLRKTVHITLSDIKVNVPIDDKKFTLAALQLTDRVCLIKETLDGKTVPMLRKDGVWVPSETTNRAEETEKVDPNSWQEKFYSIYRLEDNQVLKRIAPPFIPERKNYFLQDEVKRHYPNTPPRLVSQYFNWDGNLSIRGACMGSGIQRLNLIMESVIGLGNRQYDIPSDILNADMSGDWIVRKNTSQEELLGALARIVKDETGEDVDFVKRKVETNVIIARGKYNFQPLPNITDGQYVLISVNKADNYTYGEGGGSGALSRFLQSVGNRIEMNIIDETESEGVKLSWRYNNTSYLSGYDHDTKLYNQRLNLLLKNLTFQTGLTFSRKTATVEKWFISEKLQNTGSDVQVDAESTRAGWMNVGEIITPDFNDTKVLTEHISLGSIGEDCEGKVFITCILDSAQNNVRRHRFVLMQKSGNILEPSGYTMFGPENQLQEKFSFNAPFLTREIEGFRFQTKPSPFTGIDESLLQLLQVNSATVEQGKPAASKLAPPGRYAIELDGVDDYLLVPDSPSLRLEAPFTVEIWIKTNLLADPNIERWDWAALSKGFFVGTPRAWLTGFGIVLNRPLPEDPSQLLIDYSTANNSDLFTMSYGTASKLKNGKSDWIHISHVFNGENYKSAPGQPLVIGKFLIPTTRPLMGQIGEIRIWNGARTREQIRRYENVALAGNEPDLAAWWPFEQKEGQFAYDMSGNNNHARLGSSTGADDADPKWIDLEATTNQTDQKIDKQNEFDGRTIPTEQESTNQKTITGVVRDEKGRPLEGVKLILERIRQVFTSDTEGKFKINLDPIRNEEYEYTDFLLARDEKHNLAAVVELDKDKDFETLDIKLEPGVIISGKVVDPANRAIAGASITPFIQLPMQSTSIGGLPRQTTDSEGNFELKVMPTGPQYWVQISHFGYRKESSMNIQTDNLSADRRVDIGRIKLPVASLSVSGIVVDANDKPVANADVSISGEHQPDDVTQTDFDGKFMSEKVCDGIVEVWAYTSDRIPLHGSVVTYGGATNVKVIVTEQGTDGSLSKPPHSLVGSKLPELHELQIALPPNELNGRKILLCFWDMSLRSQNSISKLAKREKELTEKNVTVLLVHTSGVEPSKPKEWLTEHKIPFICGSIKDNVVEVLSRWGVLREPWLILTDQNRIVRAEGFDIEQLDEKLQETSSEVLIESLEKSTAGVVPRASALVENPKAPAEGKTSIYLDCVVLEVSPALKMGKEITNMLGNAPMLDSPLYMSSADLLLREAAGDKRTSQERIKFLIKKLASRGRAKMLMHPTLQLDEVQTHKFETGDNFLEVTHHYTKNGFIYMTLKAAFRSKLIQEHRKHNPIVTRREFADLICTRPGDILIIGSPIQIEEGPEGNNNAMNSEEKTTDLVFILTPNIEKQLPSLVGGDLPGLQELQIPVRPDELNGRKILLCFWDMNQRPSRNLIAELAKREKELADKNVAVLLVDTSGIEPAKLKEWLGNRNIPFPCGSIKNDAEKVLFNWGVRAQPWLILTNQNKIVQAEGFGLEQLDETIYLKPLPEEQHGKEAKEPPADKPVTRVYHIYDLVLAGARISRGAVDVTMDRSGIEAGGCENIPDEAIVNEARNIVNLIMQTIDPNSWFQNNPNATGTITQFPAARPRKLAIYQTLHAHKQIEKLLESRREQINTTQISIKLLYLYTNVEFLDEVRDSMDIKFTSDTFLDDKQVETLLRASQKKRYIKSLMAPRATVPNNVTARFGIAKHFFMSFLDYSEPDNLSQQSTPVPINMLCKITPHIEDNKNIIIDFVQDIPGLQERIIYDRREMVQPYTEAMSITNKRIPNNKTFAFLCDIKKFDQDNQTASPAGKKTLIVLIKPTIIVQQERPRSEAPAMILHSPRLIGDTKQQDQATFDKGYEVIQLSHITATEAAERVTKVLSQLPEKEFHPSVLVQPLENTGQIIIFGRKDWREIVKKLIGQLDIPNGLFETRAFRLKYADPDLIKKRIESAYEHPANEPREMVRVISYPTMKRVVVIASPENLSRIAKQIAEWDDFSVFKPRIIELQNSDPAQMARLLTKLFSEEGGDEVNIRDVIPGEDIAGPLSSHFTFEVVPETNKIIVTSNIPKAYEAVGQLILELDKQKMATKDVKQVREWIARLVKEGRLGVPKTIDETEQPADNDVTISGQCRDSGGRPLTNAQVLLFCRDSGLGSLIQIAKNETDSDGRFILGPIRRPGEEDWGRRSYFIFVPAEGHGPAWKTVNLYGPTNEPLELTAYNPAVVTGSIITEYSKPIAGAKVWVRGIISPEATEDPASRVNDLYTNAALPGWSATTEQDGSFRIAGVPDETIIQLFISHRDFAGIIVNVKPGAEAKIKVQPAATIAGRVLYGKTGKPAAGVIAQAQAVERIRIPGRYFVSWAQKVTDEQGRYKLESLNGTRYNIWTKEENLTVVALDSFRAVAGETIEAPDLVLIEGGFITGRVIDEATGEPIRPGQHSDVGIYGPSRPKSGAAIESSDIKEDGSFRIRVAPGRNYIYLRAMGEWGRDKAIASPRSQWVNVAEGQTVEVEFKIRKLTHEELEIQAKSRQKETIKYILPKTLDEVEQNGKETKEPPADDRTAKEMIEHIIDVNLPESARNCKYHSVSLGLGVVFCYGYFEIHKTDLLSLMNTSEKLPDASELGQNPFAIRQVEKALELSSEGMEWWKPLSLDNRQYANKVIFSSPSALGGYVGLAICTGEIRDDFMGVYLVYQAD